MTRTRRLAPLAATLAIAVAALAGCGGTAGGDYRANDPAAYEPALHEQSAADYAAIDSMEAADGGAPLTSADTNVSAELIVTGSASVKVQDPADALSEFTRMVEARGGHISTSEVSQSGSTPSGSATARVPADQYQALLDELADLGEILRSSTNSEDVGQTLADIDARIAALETSIERLTALMEQATTTADLLEAEQMLTYRQADLDSLTSQADYLRDQVALSTLTVTFTTTTSQPGPSGSLAEGWEFFLRSLINLFYTLMWLLPWLILGALILVPLLVVRRNRRRRRAATASAAPASVTQPPAVVPGEATTAGSLPAEGSASDRLVDDGAERGGVVREAAEEEAVDGGAEPGQEPGAR